MRRCFIVVLALTAALTAAVASAQSPAPAAGLPLAAKLQDCHTGATPEQRYAVFVGQMPAIAGTKRMAMRFDLYQRTAGPVFRHLAVPKFGIWQKSLANQSGFVFQKRVDQLVAPANYRTQISFRWYGAHNKVIRTVTRTTLVCKQPDPRPNLKVGKVKGTRGPKATVNYDITVHNAGLGDAGPFGVLLTVNGTSQPEQTVSGLAPGAATDVIINAIPCTPGSAITIQLDPANQVAEANEADNAITRPCP
jgi:CARDB